MSTFGAKLYAVRALAEIGVSDASHLLIDSPGVNVLKVTNMLEAAYDAGHSSGLAAHPDNLCEDESCPHFGIPHICVTPDFSISAVRLVEAKKLLEEMSKSREFLLYIDPDSTYGKRVTKWLGDAQ